MLHIYNTYINQPDLFSNNVYPFFYIYIYHIFLYDLSRATEKMSWISWYNIQHKLYIIKIT